MFDSFMSKINNTSQNKKSNQDIIDIINTAAIKIIQSHNDFIKDKKISDFF